METIDQISARRAYAAVCAKLGEPDAAAARSSGSLAELHNSRKAVRRLLNKLAAAPGEPYDAEALAMAHAANLVERIGGTINALGGFEAAESTDGIKAMRTAADFQAHYRPKSNTEDRIGVADFVRGVAGMGTTVAVRNALAGGTDSAGGYTLPSMVMPDILQALVPVSAVLKAGAGIVPLPEGAKSFTTAAINAIPNAAWRLESGAVAQSDPTFRGVVTIPRSLSFYFKISRELLADASNIGAALTIAIAQSMAKELDRAALRGTGTAPEPRGLLNTNGVATLSHTGATETLNSYQDFFAAGNAIMLANAPAPTAAIMSPRSYYRLAGLIDTTQQPQHPPPMVEAMQLIGTSQIPENLTVSGNNLCSEMYIGSFNLMNIMMRENLSITVAPELYAGTGEIAFFCHCRADVTVLYPAAFAVVTGLR